MNATAVARSSSASAPIWSDAAGSPIFFKAASSAKWMRRTIEKHGGARNESDANKKLKKLVRRKHAKPKNGEHARRYVVELS